MNEGIPLQRYWIPIDDVDAPYLSEDGEWIRYSDHLDQVKLIREKYEKETS